MEFLHNQIRLGVAIQGIWMKTIRKFMVIYDIRQRFDLLRFKKQRKQKLEAKSVETGRMMVYAAKFLKASRSSVKVQAVD